MQSIHQCALTGGIELRRQDTAGDDIAHQLQAADALDFDEAAAGGGGETGGCESGGW
jgi:hypothetical protein